MKKCVIVVCNERVSFNSKKHISLQKACLEPLWKLALLPLNLVEKDVFILCNEDEKKAFENQTCLTEKEFASFDFSEYKEVLFISPLCPCIKGESVKNALETFEKEKKAIKLGESIICSTSDAISFPDIKTVNFPLPEDEAFVCKTRGDILKAGNIIKERTNSRLMDNGVSFIAPENTYISPFAEIGVDSLIYPEVFIEGESKIGENCTIYGNTTITNSILKNNITVKSSVILDSEIGDNTSVGPFAYIRPNSQIGENVKVGDFVEIKKSKIGNGTKISHLTYVGDSVVGERVNFGCGTVTVNYDGKNKFTTTIGNDCFIGCNTNLVSPVTVNDNAFIAAGSTITDDVEENALAIARARQINKKGWVKPKDR